MSEHDANEVIQIIEVEEPAVLLVEPPSSIEPEEAGNPDAWLQWALIIGLLALFLICTILILVAWNGR